MGTTNPNDVVNAKQIISIYEQAEKQILEKLSGDLSEWGKAYFTKRKREIKVILDNLKSANGEFAAKMVPQTYSAGINLVEQRFSNNVAFSKIHQSNIERLANNLAKDMNDPVDFIGRRVNDVFRQVSLKSLAQSEVIGENRRVAVQKLVDNFTSNGISSFVDGRGAQWNMKVYADMVVRTTSREVAKEGILTRLTERGNDLVEITETGDSCDLCSEWEGQILSISGDSTEYDSLDDAEAAGLFHPNCTHVPVPYIE